MANPDDCFGAGALTRRQMLARGGLAAGMLGAASLGFARPLAAAPPAPRTGFDGRRRRAYVALVAAVGTVAGTPVDRGRAHWAADRLASDYARRTPESRRAIDGVLDALDARDFARLDDRGRVAMLRSWAGSDRDYRDLAAHATGLASLPFTPAPESEDDVVKPVPVAL